MTGTYLAARAQYAARSAARKTVLGIFAIAFAFGAITLLSAALWMIAAKAWGVIVATAALGALHAVVALVLLLAGRSGSSQPVPSEPQVAPDSAIVPRLIDAFMGGLAAGRATRRRR